MSDFINSCVSSSSLLDFQSGNTFKHLGDVLKNWLWIFRLTNDFKKIIVGQEVESWELSSLCLQELVQVLLNLLEFLVEVVEEVEESFDNQRLLSVLDLVDSLHLSLEDLIVSLEDRVFVRELLGNIWLTFEN